MACSKDGTKIAIAGEFTDTNPWPDFIIEFFYFDNQTGNLSNPIQFNTSSDTGEPVMTASATLSNNSICIGDCVDYTNASIGSIVTYDSTFQGGAPSTSSGANPTQVCYPTVENFNKSNGSKPTKCLLFNDRNFHFRTNVFKYLWNGQHNQRYCCD